MAYHFVCEPSGYTGKQNRQRTVFDDRFVATIENHSNENAYLVTYNQSFTGAEVGKKGFGSI